MLLVNSTSSGAYDSLCVDAAWADVVGLDVEWAPDLKPGSNNPISVLQLAFPQSKRVYVLQLRHLGGQLPKEVQMMLVNPAVVKVAFAVDVADTAKFVISGIRVARSSLVDVQTICSAYLECRRPIGLRDACRRLLGYSLAKDMRLVCSDWSRPELTPAQVRYAALDAWVTLRLYFCTMEFDTYTNPEPSVSAY